MNNNKKFLNIPVPMMKDLYADRKKFFENVFDVGIYLYSKTLTGLEEKRYRDASDFFGIKQKYIRDCIANAKEILFGMPEKYPLTGIEIDMLWDYYKNEKNDFDIVCIGAFLGIKSILGKKPYDKTNKALIHARMFGYTSAKVFPTQLNPLQEKYKIRWHMDKVLLELQTNWHLKILWNHNRGFYISFDLTFDEMALIIEKAKQLTKIQQIKELKIKAIESAKTQFTTH